MKEALETPSSQLDQIAALDRGRLTRQAASLLRNWQAGEDAVGHVLEKMVEYTQAGREIKHVRGYAEHAVQMRCFNVIRTRTRHWKKQQSNPQRFLSITHDTPEDLVIQADTNRAVREAVRELPEKYEEAVTVYHLEDRTVVEAAEELELNTNTVKSRVKRGRDKMREVLSELVA